MDSTFFDIAISLDPVYEIYFTDSMRMVSTDCGKQKDSWNKGELGLYNFDQIIIKQYTPDFGQDIRMDFTVGPIP